MQLSDLPARFPVPFASSAGSGFIRTIPTAHQTASPTDAPASLHDGFPPETFTPLDSGGVPPAGADMNGLHYQETAGIRWSQAGGAALFNSDFAAAIGGYPKLAQLASTSPGTIWQSTVDNNMTDPDGGAPVGWIAITTNLGTDANYYRLPGGYIEQFGYQAGPYSGGAVTVTLPVAYSSATTFFPMAIVYNTDGTQPADNLWLHIESRTANTFTVRFRFAGSGSPLVDGFFWQTKGR